MPIMESLLTSILPLLRFERLTRPTQSNAQLYFAHIVETALTISDESLHLYLTENRYPSREFIQGCTKCANETTRIQLSCKTTLVENMNSTPESFAYLWLTHKNSIVHFITFFLHILMLLNRYIVLLFDVSIFFWLLKLHRCDTLSKSIFNSPTKCIFPWMEKSILCDRPIKSNSDSVFFHIL